MMDFDVDVDVVISGSTNREMYVSGWVLMLMV